MSTYDLIRENERPLVARGLGAVLILAPAVHWPIRKMTNSAGRSGATPTSTLSQAFRCACLRLN